MTTTTPQRPDEPEELDAETRAILDQRLKTVDADAKSARPWREVRDGIQNKLKHLAPK